MMNPEDDIDVMLLDPVIIDMEIFEYWLRGFTVEETAQAMQRNGVLVTMGCSKPELVSSLTTQMVQFKLLTKYLLDPAFFLTQNVFDIDQQVRQQMINKYYQFDALVVREFLGKKLTAKDRRELDEVSEKTLIPLASCRRQFDNIRRVFKRVEEMPGSLVGNIRSCFHLSEALAQQYAAVVFLTNNKFETGKKRLAFVSFHDFVFCANEMMEHWSYGSKACTTHEDMDVDLDLQFFIELKDLKLLTEKDTVDDFKSAVCNGLSGAVSDKVWNDMEANFKNICKIIVGIAVGLNHSREVKDLFVDIAEKLVEPYRNLGWTKSDMELFLAAVQETGKTFFTHKRQERQFIRFIGPFSRCVVQLFHA